MILEYSKIVVECLWPRLFRFTDCSCRPLKNFSFLNPLSLHSKLQLWVQEAGTLQFAQYRRLPCEASMDAYPMSYTSPSRRNSSRIYRDLAAYRLSRRHYTYINVQPFVVNYQSEVCHSRISFRISQNSFETFLFFPWKKCGTGFFLIQASYASANTHDLLLGTWMRD